MNKLLIIWIFLLAELCNNPVHSQSLQFSFDDSIVCSGSSMFATNIVRLTNNSTDSLLTKISASVPKGWQLIGSKNKEIILAPKETIRLPFSFKKTAASSANWEQAMLHFSNVSFDTSVGFLLKALPVYRSSISLGKQQLFITSLKDGVTISVVVKNTGNIEDAYSLMFENELLNLHKKTTVALKAGESDTLLQKINISKSAFKQLKTEKIHIQLKSTHGVFLSTTCDVGKSSSIMKDQPSAYDLMDVESENGVLVNGKNTAFYSSITGKTKINESKLNFSYKTKQFGSNNSLYSNVFTINFSNKKWLLHAGQSIDNRFYYSTGNGFEINYVDKNKEWSFAGILADKKLFQSANSLNAGLKQNFKKWNVVSEIALGRQLHQNSLLQYNLISYKGLKGLLIQIGAGAGKFLSAKAPAFAAQYKISFDNKRWSIESKMVRNNLMFPGIQRGLTDDHHSLGVKFKNFSASAFYTKNHTYINYFRDTVYNSDALSINNERLGMSLQFIGSKGSFGISGGQMSSSFLAAGPGRYQFVEGNLSKTLFKSILISGNISYGENKSLHIADKNMHFTNAYLRIASKWGGFNLSVLDLPQIDFVTKVPTGISSTMNLGPFVQATFFKKLSLYVNYQVSKTALDNYNTRMLISNINYTEPKSHISFSFSGMIPLVKSHVNTLGFNQTYMSFTLKKQFSLPVLFHQKFPSMKMFVFYDENADLKKTGDEKVFDSVKLLVNAAHFQPKQGIATYKNLKKGDYTIELSDLPKGYTSISGKTMKVSLRKNTIVFIPIVKSKVISGHVQVEDDSLSTIRFTVAGVKVIAIDSAGNQFSSICDDKGNYFINVPANTYTVSLNPEAFDNVFKPVQMEYPIDVITKNEEVNFYIKQAKRKIRLLQQKNE